MLLQKSLRIVKLSTLKNFQEPMSIASLTRLCTKNAFDVRFDTLLEVRLETCQKQLV